MYIHDCGYKEAEGGEKERNVRCGKFSYPAHAHEHEKLHKWQKMLQNDVACATPDVPQCVCVCTGQGEDDEEWQGGEVGRGHGISVGAHKIR